ncbi:MAG TPA: hypothetical protein VHD55_03450 [Candidatus Paceibacterota bacterium]|nr:hypothetical protein [Candidatus Paceibacterota bacterium]
MDHHTSKWASGSTPLDYSPHGAPRQQPQSPRELPDPRQVSQEREQNRQYARYRKRGYTRNDLERTRKIGGD